MKQVIKNQNGLIQIEQINSLDDISHEEIMKKFQKYTNSKIIEAQYNELTWSCSDQKVKYHIKFGYKQAELCKVCAEAEISYEYLIEKLKEMVVLLLGTIALVRLRTLVKYTIDELVASHCCQSLDTRPNDSNIVYLAYYLDFIQTLSFANEAYIEKCKGSLTAGKALMNDLRKEDKHPCALNECMSYFILDIIVRDYLKTASGVSRKYFMPFILFWLTTTVLPLRVTEFCVMPDDCIRKKGELCYLKIRRSRLKGNYATSIRYQAYKIEADYYQEEFEIPQWLYDLYLEYKKSSEGYLHPYNLFFSTDYLLSLEYGSVRTKLKDAAFGRRVLSDIKEDFYREIVVLQYGYQIITEEDLLKRYLKEDGSFEMYDKEIMMLQTKHTRHLALINLLYRGCNPMLLKEFSGHSDEAMAFHYAGNLSKMVRCMTKIYYDRFKTKANGSVKYEDVDINPLSILINESDPSIEVDGGRCYSKEFINGNITDCVSCDGICEHCSCFIPDHGKKVEQTCEDQMNKEVQFISGLLTSSEVNNKLEELNQHIYRVETLMRQYAQDYWKEMEKKDGEKIRLQFDRT